MNRTENDRYDGDSGQTASSIREVVFGAEDGMVSTLGAVTGVAVGSQDHFTVLLAGTVIIAVESVSMGIGSYLANRSEREVRTGALQKERREIRDYPEEEREELRGMLIRDGWPESLSGEMAEAAFRNPHLMLREMAYRELGSCERNPPRPVRNAALMFMSYAVGGSLALSAYLFLPVSRAMPVSMAMTLLGLFALGAAMSRYTKTSWLKSGARILLLGGVALAVGLAVGELSKAWR